MINGLKGTHIATGYPVEIPLNGKEMQLAMDTGPYMNESWDMMCDSVVARGDYRINGEIEIDFIVVGGNQKVFH